MDCQRRKLIFDHIPNVHIVANSIKRSWDNIDFIKDDLVSAGYEGLVRASINFDHSINERFWTYAEHRVRGSILDETETELGFHRMYHIRQHPHESYDSLKEV